MHIIPRIAVTATGAAIGLAIFELSPLFQDLTFRIAQATFASNRPDGSVERRLELKNHLTNCGVVIGFGSLSLGAIVGYISTLALDHLFRK